MPVVILSPHLDDAVLSCWHVLDQPGEVTVINVFAGTPPAGSVAGWWDLSTGGADPSGAVIARIEEDRAALDLAERQAQHLKFLDHQYRRAPQPVAAVAEAVGDLLPSGAQVWAPAGIAPPPEHPASQVGWTPHPDHVVARDAALSLRARGHPVALYADLPHATSGGLPDWVIGGADGSGPRVAEIWRQCLASAGLARLPNPQVTRLSGEAFERKLRAVRRYESQLKALERSFGPLDDRLLLGYEVVWPLP